MRYRDLFRDPEFSGMYVADVLTMTGTYLSRLAVAVLVYGRTQSVGLTALTFVVSFAPYLLAPWLSTFADRLPRKRLLVSTDVVRALLVVVLVVPGIPLAPLLAVVFTLEMLQIPFGAARLAVLSDVLPDDRFPVGNALVASTRQALQVGGFIVGAAVVAATSPQVALVIDSATYAMSALLIMIFVRHRALPWGPDHPAPRLWSGALEGVRFVRETPGMPHLFLLLALGPGLIVIAEGLAVPFADQLGGGTQLAGLLMATAPIGNVIGFAIAGKLSFTIQRRLVYPLAATAGLTVALAGVAGELAESALVVIMVLTVSGATLAYLNAIQSEVAAVVPREARGRVFGLGNAVMQIAQGAAVGMAGLLAEAASIGRALILFGAAGMVLVGLIAIAGRRHVRGRLR
ncbi:MAG TPA: MFS transporter [Nocardioidaceae bacterium]|nr:MFS transporter [Nocardioidaceae bacterium]